MDSDCALADLNLLGHELNSVLLDYVSFQLLIQQHLLA
jgi:hypothetical protein